MKNKTLKILLTVLAILVLIWLGANLLLNRNDAKFNEKMNQAMANPASEFCIRNGGISEIVNKTDGSQSGVCIFGEGKSCDETDLFRNTCNVDGVINSVVYKNASSSVFASYNLKTDKVYISSLDLHMNNLEMTSATSASGARYLSQDGEVEIWEHQGVGRVSIRGEEIFEGNVVRED